MLNTCIHNFKISFYVILNASSNVILNGISNVTLIVFSTAILNLKSPNGREIHKHQHQQL